MRTTAVSTVGCNAVSLAALAFAASAWAAFASAGSAAAQKFPCDLLSGSAVGTVMHSKIAGQKYAPSESASASPTGQATGPSCAWYSTTQGFVLSAQYSVLTRAALRTEGCVPIKGPVRPACILPNGREGFVLEPRLTLAGLVLKATPKAPAMLAALLKQAASECAKVCPAAPSQAQRPSANTGVGIDVETPTGTKVTVRLTRCFVNSQGEQEAIVDVRGISGYTAAVDFYAWNGQFEERAVAAAISKVFNPSAATVVDAFPGKSFTCHLAKVSDLVRGGHTIYADSFGGQPQAYGPVPPGLNLIG